MNQSKSMTSADFREFLDRELSQRSSLNPNYSLRAFARDLGVDSSFLSKLLNGKRSMTARTILTLAPRLSLTEDQIQSYVRGANGRRRRFSMSHENYAPIVELDNVSEQLDWVHLALLAMFDLKGFNPETPSINQRLDFPCEKLEVLLTDLAAMKLIAKSEDGTWCKEKTRYSICSQKFPRVNHVKRQILEQATIMIPENFGDHSAMTFAISEARIPEANNRIIKFRRELAEFLYESDDKDHVYHLSISLFPAIKNLR